MNTGAYKYLWASGQPDPSPAQRRHKAIPGPGTGCLCLPWHPFPSDFFITQNYLIQPRVSPLAVGAKPGKTMQCVMCVLPFL